MRLILIIALLIGPLPLLIPAQDAIPYQAPIISPGEKFCNPDYKYTTQERLLWPVTGYPLANCKPPQDILGCTDDSGSGHPEFKARCQNVV